MMKVLVIGGTRFIGLHLVQQLNSLGYDISLLNRGKTPAQIPSGIKRLYADRRDPAAVKKALHGQEFEVIFDLTGYELKNVEPVVDLFVGKIQHYIFLSTAEVYAKSIYLPVLEDFPRQSGTTADRGLAAYGATKVQCEEFLLEKYRSFGFPVTIFRCPVIYGPNNWMHDREFSFFTRLTMGRQILVPGNGANIMHFAYVDDVVRACINVLEHHTALGQVFNIAGAEAITIEGYIDTIAGLIGVEAKKMYIDSRFMASLRQAIFPFGWAYNFLLGINKAKENFGFWPQYRMKEGLTQSYQWWQQNIGVTGTHFEKGRLGYNVDLTYEDQIINTQEAKKEGIDPLSTERP